MRKRHLHAFKLQLEQGRILSPLPRPPHPPLTDAIREAGWLCVSCPPPFPPTHSPCWIYVIFSVLGQKRGWPLLRGSKVLQLNSDSFCDYVRIWTEVIGHYARLRRSQKLEILPSPNSKSLGAYFLGAYIVHKARRFQWPPCYHRILWGANILDVAHIFYICADILDKARIF